MVAAAAAAVVAAASAVVAAACATAADTSIITHGGVGWARRGVGHRAARGEGKESWTTDERKRMTESKRKQEREREGGRMRLEGTA